MFDFENSVNLSICPFWATVESAVQHGGLVEEGPPSLLI